MWFVYLHIAWFSIWIALGVEYYQYGLLTILDLTKTIYKLTLAHELALGGPPAASKRETTSSIFHCSRRGSCRLDGYGVRYEPAPSVVWQA